MPDLVSQSEKVAYIEVIARTILAEEPDDPRFRPVMREFRDRIEDLVAHPKKRDVDSAFADLSDMCRDSSAEMRRAISAELQRRIFRPLSYFEKARLARIDRIVGRGRIRTDDEWRLVEERIQELCEEGESSTQREMLDRLLWKYRPKTEA